MNQETKYQLLIIKIQEIKAGLTGSEFSPSELELIAEALETIQFLEIIFKARKQSFGEAKENHEI